MEDHILSKWNLNEARECEPSWLIGKQLAKASVSAIDEAYFVFTDGSACVIGPDLSNVDDEETDEYTFEMHIAYGDAEVDFNEHETHWKSRRLHRPSSNRVQHPITFPDLRKRTF